MQPKITVITISFNNLSELKRTVNSVTSQTCKEYEYIIIDGGSSDGTKEYLEQTKGIDKWVSEPDTGIYNAMNKGIKMATGKYTIFMNSGDEFYDSSIISKAVPLLAGGDIYTGNTILDDNGIRKERLTPKELTLEFLLKTAIMHQSTFIRTKLLKERPYDETLRIVSDWEWFLYEWVYNERSYHPLNFFVSIYYTGGISNNPKTKDLNYQERKYIVNKWIPKRVQLNYDVYISASPLERKVQLALNLPPIQRDLKLLRNAFKALIKDCFWLMIGSDKMYDGKKNPNLRHNRKGKKNEKK